MLRYTFLTILTLSALLVQASIFSPFQSALDFWNDEITTNKTSHELLKRESNACPTNYNACTNEGAPGLCCAHNQICTADNNGYVACCPTGATCTGTITGVITSGTISGGTALLTATTTGTSDTALLTSGVSSTSKTTSASNLLVSATGVSTTSGASATTTGGFVIAASSTVATIGSSDARKIKIPLYARCLIKLFEYLPL